MMGKLSGWLVMLPAIFCMACASSSVPATYYGLQSAAAPPEQSLQNPLTIGVGPVVLPDYLDRAAIVTRVSPNRLQINTGHRWAGSLQNEILQALAGNLKHETASRQVVVFPWGSNFEPDIRFRVSIHAFEGQLARRIHLNATWAMTRRGSDQVVFIGDSDIAEEITGKDFEALADAMGRALATMSHDMAAAVGSGHGAVAQETQLEN
jgi:uncharacterized protein